MAGETTAARRLDELRARHGLDAHGRQRLATLLALLQDDPTAPTAVSSPELAVDVHIADSLTALDLERVRTARAIADIGSGAGVPGLALAAVLPGAEVWLIESRRRKCEFIERAAASMGLENATAVCARAEEWDEGLERHDVVVARALAPPAVVLEYAAPLLELGGALVDWRAARRPDEERAAALAAQELGLVLEEVRAVAPLEGPSDHHLHVWAKRAPTPPRFPRRAGIARKRPLGS